MVVNLAIGIRLTGKCEDERDHGQHCQYMDRMALMLPNKEPEYPTYNEEYGYEK